MTRSRDTTSAYGIVMTTVSIVLVFATGLALMIFSRARNRNTGSTNDNNEGLRAAYARLAAQAHADRTYGVHLTAPASHVTMPDRLRPVAPHVFDSSSLGARPELVPGREVVDVRVHDTQPPPPMHAFAVAVGGPFEQVGIVYSLEADKRYPLFSRAAPHHRHRYQYYVSTDNSSVQISARVEGRDCGESMGCTELYTGDTIEVPELGTQTFTVKLFAK